MNNKKKNKRIVNYSKIKRNILIRDTGLDSRFVTKKVSSDKQKMKTKPPKHKPDWKDGEDD